MIPSHSKRTVLAFLLGASLCVSPATAAPVAFDNNWMEQKFRLFSKNTYRPKGGKLEILSDGTVSMLWSRVPQRDWAARKAAWRWTVAQSVPPTDLALKGGDDRNVALYFVFLPREQAERIAGNGSIRALLESESARVLVYVWGGDHPRGAVLPSPYLGARGITVVLRPSGTGSFRETVDLAADYKRIFRQEAGVLVGLAVSADSDDTRSTVRADVADLTLN